MKISHPSNVFVSEVTFIANLKADKNLCCHKPRNHLRNHCLDVGFPFGYFCVFSSFRI